MLNNTQFKRVSAKTLRDRNRVQRLIMDTSGGINHSVESESEDSFDTNGMSGGRHLKKSHHSHHDDEDQLEMHLIKWHVEHEKQSDLLRNQLDEQLQLNCSLKAEIDALHKQCDHMRESKRRLELELDEYMEHDQQVINEQAQQIDRMQKKMLSMDAENKRLRIQRRQLCSMIEKLKPYRNTRKMKKQLKYHFNQSNTNHNNSNNNSTNSNNNNNNNSNNNTSNKLRSINSTFNVSTPASSSSIAARYNMKASAHHHHHHHHLHNSSMNDMNDHELSGRISPIESDSWAEELLHELGSDEDEHDFLKQMTFDPWTESKLNQMSSTMRSPMGCMRKELRSANLCDLCSEAIGLNTLSSINNRSRRSDPCNKSIPSDQSFSDLDLPSGKYQSEKEEDFYSVCDRFATDDQFKSIADEINQITDHQRTSMNRKSLISTNASGPIEYLSLDMESEHSESKTSAYAHNQSGTNKCTLHAKGRKCIQNGHVKLNASNNDNTNHHINHDDHYDTLNGSINHNTDEDYINNNVVDNDGHNEHDTLNHDDNDDVINEHANDHDTSDVNDQRHHIGNVNGNGNKGCQCEANGLGDASYCEQRLRKAHREYLLLNEYLSSVKNSLADVDKMLLALCYRFGLEKRILNQYFDFCVFGLSMEEYFRSIQFKIRLLFTRKLQVDVHALNELIRKGSIHGQFNRYGNNSSRISWFMTELEAMNTLIRCQHNRLLRFPIEQ